MNELEFYLGTKLIKACPMTNFGFACSTNKNLSIEEFEKTKKIEDGYFVVYEDGYQSWSPRDVFEKAYRATSGLSFGLAIEALKLGKKVARMGWNDKGMFLWLKPATVIESAWCKDPMLKSIADNNEGFILALGTICMYTHDSTGRKAILTGWLASQSDMLSDDWYIVE